MKSPQLRLMFLIAGFVGICHGQIEITLNKDFVHNYSNRATITSNFQIDKTSVIHPPSQDGDIHAAGTGSTIGMIAVARAVDRPRRKDTKRVRQSGRG
jgi:hypothetical protein